MAPHPTFSICLEFWLQPNDYYWLECKFPRLILFEYLIPDLCTFMHNLMVSLSRILLVIICINVITYFVINYEVIILLTYSSLLLIYTIIIIAFLLYNFYFTCVDSFIELDLWKMFFLKFPLLRYLNVFDLCVHIIFWYWKYMTTFLLTDLSTTICQNKTNKYSFKTINLLQHLL